MFLKYFLAACICTLFGNVKSQPRHDYIWLLGDTPFEPQFYSGGCTLDFNKDPVEISVVKISGGAGHSYQPMSDSAGNLLYYTNGCDVFTADFQVMDNGDNLNPGFNHQRYCNEQLGFGYVERCLNIPYPDAPHKYVLIHSAKNGIDTYISQVYQTIIDMSKNNGQGSVIAKNVPFLKDSFDNNPAAVRHANGRDWWIIFTRPVDPMGFHRMLLTPQGLEYVGIQYPGIDVYFKKQSCFSPDGNKYCIASNNPPNIYTFDFDRVTGNFSNPQSWNPPYDSIPFSTRGIAVSPNSRFLYVTTGTTLWQYDLSVSNIEASGQVIYQANQPGESIKTTLLEMQITPDNRIFVMPYQNSLTIHAIQHPNMPGLSCGFELDAIKLPVFNYLSLPYFPSFRLGPLVGIKSDYLGASSASVSITPNPADGEIKVEIANLEGDPQFELYDALGRVVYQEHLYDRYTYLPVAFLPSAVYFYRIRRAQQPRPEGGKVVIRH